MHGEGKKTGLNGQRVGLRIRVIRVTEVPAT